jgi:tetratricopeptide (TPR) repeat protein
LYVSRLFPRAFPGIFIAAAASALLVFYSGAHGSFRRWLFVAEDYASDVMRSAPPGSSVVAKKDVQLFSLWYMQSVKGLRPDLNVVAQGLSGAPWYQAVQRRYNPGLVITNLNTGGQPAWKAFISANKGGVYATMDTELPRPLPLLPMGLVNSLSPAPSGAEAYPPWPLYAFPRLDLDYRDFFDSDLGTSYAQGLLSQAAKHNGAGALTTADLEALRLVSLLDPDLPDAPLYEGFYYFSRGDWQRAGGCFRASIDIYERLLALSAKYYSLPEVRNSLSSSSAYAWLNYGVSVEKTGDRRRAEDAYAMALQRNPGLAEAHYNMAILYWNRDWDKVRAELSETLRVDPNHAQARRYLEQVKGRH